MKAYAPDYVISAQIVICTAGKQLLPTGAVAQVGYLLAVGTAVALVFCFVKHKAGLCYDENHTQEFCTRLL